MKACFQPGRVACAVALWGAALATHAQVAPAALTCAAGASTTSLTLVTEPATWQVRDVTGTPTAWAPAAAASDPNSGWVAASGGSSWIGVGANGLPVADFEFLREVAVGASVDTSTLQLAYAFNVDNSLTSLTVNGATMGASGGSYNNAPTSGTAAIPDGGAATYPIVARVHNAGGPYGLAMALTISARCRPVAAPAPVPANDPTALLALAGLVAAAGGFVAARRRRKI